MNKNQLVRKITTPSTPIHVELQSAMSSQPAGYPETAYITYYEPVDVMTQKPSKLVIMIRHFFNKFASEPDEIEMASELGND